MKTCSKTSQTWFKKKRETYQMLGIVSRVIGNKVENTIITLHKYVFTHKVNTVCCVQLWSPDLIKKKKPIRNGKHPEKNYEDDQSYWVHWPQGVVETKKRQCRAEMRSLEQWVARGSWMAMNCQKNQLPYTDSSRPVKIFPKDFSARKNLTP